MLLLIVLAVLLLMVFAPATRYGGYYPSTWHPGYGWVPALVVAVLLVWLIAGGVPLR
jgi:hypothetical protein